MKKNYLKYYVKPSALAPMKFSADMIFAKRGQQKLSLQNRQADYLKLIDNPQLLALHLKLNECLLDGIENYDAYDYGEGYFYQSLAEIGVSGFRDTEGRLAAMDIFRYVEGKTVLEIGCNAGFLSVAIASKAKQVTGFDIAPHLIAIGKLAAGYLNRTNVDLKACAFEDFKGQGKFDVVLSFANHSTFDGQTKHSIEEYFQRCADLCADGGLLLFESHPPEHEGDGLEGVIETLSKFFKVTERRILDYNGGFLDSGRTFVVAEKKVG